VDVELLDSVIERASPTATTFLPVFKAYNDILQERGIDPHEVVYYGKLLKLGTLKGKNWGDKWEMVKLQHGYGTRTLSAQKTPIVPLTQKPLIGALMQKPHIAPHVIAKRLNTKPSTPHRDDYSLTCHSHSDETEAGPSERRAPTQVPEYHRTPESLAQSASSFLSDDFATPFQGFNVPVFQPPLTAFQPLAASPIITRAPPEWSTETSDAYEPQAEFPPSTPPSYKVAVRSPVLRRQYVPRSRDRPTSTPADLTVCRPDPPPSGRRRGSVVIHEDEAWNKIKMAQDEKEADLFYEAILVERCWDVWKQGFEWVRVSHFYHSPLFLSC
jgi:protein SFI1